MNESATLRQIASCRVDRWRASDDRIRVRPPDRPSLVSPVIDYEPPPVGVSACRSTPALRGDRARRAATGPHPHRAAMRPHRTPRSCSPTRRCAGARGHRPAPARRPAAAAAGARAGRHRDRRLARVAATTAAATLRRVRLRMVDGDGERRRGVRDLHPRPRVRAIAARIDVHRRAAGASSRCAG